MKKKLLSIGLFCSIILFMGSMQIRQTGIVDFRNKIESDSKAFLKSCYDLHQLAEDMRLKKRKQEHFAKQLLETRLAYKKVEYIWAYYYPAFVEEHINGAPLYHAERYDTRPIVLPPEGLQVLDEMAFSEMDEAAISQAIILSKTLYNNAQMLINGHQTEQLTKAELLLAQRQQIVRIFTLGISGFDTPGSLNALPEAAMSLRSLKEGLALLPALKENDFKRINSRYELAITDLEQAADFENFDRLYFLKTSINPLYKQLGAILSKEGISSERSKSSALDMNADNLFANNFLDPYFYTELKRKEDSPELRQLGEKLFYENKLSADNQINCSSCHHPDKAFSDGERKSNSNIAGVRVQRNAPSLVNAVYADRYFYDLRAFSLEQQAEHVIFNNAEFNSAYQNILDKLNADESYKSAFKQVFGEKKIKRAQLSKALASYVLSLSGFESPFDQYIRDETTALDPKVKEGFNLFMGKAACGTCHFAPTFSGLVPPKYNKNETEILGVLENPNGWGKNIDPDMGRYNNQILSEQAWIYERSFKTVSLRNVELTAPYFHNGAFKTLESVVDFYDHGGGGGLGLEVKNQTLSTDSLHLTKYEKETLIAFMKALTN
jgi:cytochrome c peroxidase